MNKCSYCKKRIKKSEWKTVVGEDYYCKKCLKNEIVQQSIKLQESIQQTRERNMARMII